MSAGSFITASMYTSILVRHHLLLPAPGERDTLSELTLLPVMSRLNVPCAVVCDALNEHMIQQIWPMCVVTLRVSVGVRAGGSATCVIGHVAHLVEAVGQRSKALHMG